MRDVILETQVDYHGPYLRVFYDRCEIIMNYGLLSADGGCNGPFVKNLLRP
jgi:phosphoenolpyruvate carboxylase